MLKNQSLFVCRFRRQPSLPPVFLRGVVSFGTLYINAVMARFAGIHTPFRRTITCQCSCPYRTIKILAFFRVSPIYPRGRKLTLKRTNSRALGNNYISWLIFPEQAVRNEKHPNTEWDDLHLSNCIIVWNCGTAVYHMATLCIMNIHDEGVFQSAGTWWHRQHYSLYEE